MAQHRHPVGSPRERTEKHRVQLPAPERPTSRDDLQMASKQSGYVGEDGQSAQIANRGRRLPRRAAGVEVLRALAADHLDHNQDIQEY